MDRCPTPWDQLFQRTNSCHGSLFSLSNINNQTYRIKQFLFLTLNNILTPPCLRLNAHLKKQLYDRQFLLSFLHYSVVSHSLVLSALADLSLVTGVPGPSGLATCTKMMDEIFIHSGSCSCSEFPAGGFISWHEEYSVPELGTPQSLNMGACLPEAQNTVDCCSIPLQIQQ